MKLYEIIDQHKSRGILLFVDMDGVLAEYDIGNFDYSTIRPLKSNIEKIKGFCEDVDIEVYLLSVCKTNRIVKDKVVWLGEHMSFLKDKQMIFLSKEAENYNGESSVALKSNYLKDVNSEGKTIMLIDDDISIIKYVVKNNPDVIVFQDSSLID